LEKDINKIHEKSKWRQLEKFVQYTGKKINDGLSRLEDNLGSKCKSRKSQKDSPGEKELGLFSDGIK